MSVLCTYTLIKVAKKDVMKFFITANPIWSPYENIFITQHRFIIFYNHSHVDKIESL